MVDDGIFVFSDDRFLESLRSSNIMVPPKNTDPHPCTLAAAFFFGHRFSVAQSLKVSCRLLFPFALLFTIIGDTRYRFIVVKRQVR